MVNRLTVNALGFTIALLAVSACGAPQPKIIEISAKPIEKPELVLPEADRLQTQEVKWVLITPDNFEAQVEALRKAGKPVVFFALTDSGYEALALNLSDLRAFIQQQQAIIVAYEGYYKDSNSALDQANAEIEAANATTMEAAQQPTRRWPFN